MPGPGRTRRGERAEARFGRGRRAPVALSVDRRARHAVCRAPRHRQAQIPDDDTRARSTTPPWSLRGARPAGLRDFQPCPARKRVPAQPRLLARPRICRHRPGRPRPAGSTGARHATATEKRPEVWLTQVEAARPRARHRRRADARGNGRRVPADGPAARRGHRIARFARSPAGRSIRTASPRCTSTA